MAARSRCVLVEASDRVIGILTKQDIVRLIAQQSPLDCLTLRQVMTRTLVALRETAGQDVFTIASLFEQHQICHLPILDEHDQLVGLVTDVSLPIPPSTFAYLRRRSVAEVMTQPVVCAGLESDLLTISRQMTAHQVGSVVIIDPTHALSENGPVYPVGIVTSGDLLQPLSQGLDLSRCPAATVMSGPVISICPDASLLSAQQLLEQHQIRRLVVTGAYGEPVGIVTQANILRALRPSELCMFIETLTRQLERLEAAQTGQLGQADGQAGSLVAQTLTCSTPVVECPLTLHTQAACYRALLTSTSDGILLIDREGQIVEANQKALELLGYARSELLGMSFTELHPPEAIPLILAKIARVINNGETCEALESDWRCQDGQLLPMSTNAAVLTVNGKTLIQVTFRDIRDRRQMTAATKQAQALYQQIVKNMAEGLCVCHPITTFPFLRFTLWNPQMHIITGYSVEEINRLGWHQCLYPNAENQAAAIARMERVFKGDHLVGAEWEIHRRDGQRRTIAISTSALTPYDGQQYVLALVQDITDRTQLEWERQCLLQQLSSFKFALDQAAIVAMTDSQGKVTYVNDKLCQITGYSREEWLGQTYRLIHSGYHPPQFFVDLWSTLQKGQVWRGEICNRAKAGHLYWVDSTVVPFLNSQGKVEQSLAICFDITPRKWAEAQINQQLAAIEAAIDGIAILRDETYVYLNRSYLQMFGYDDPEDLLGQSWRCLYSPEEIARFETEVFPALVRDRAWEGEAIAIRKDGSTFDEGLSLTLTADGLLICVCRDITEHKQVELALADYAWEVEDLYNNAPCGYHSLDAEGRIVQINDTELQWLGYTREEVLDRPWTDFIDAEGHAQFAKSFAIFKQQGSIKDLEFTLVCKDGRRMPVLVSATAVTDANGQYLYSRTTLFDISERKRAEALLQQQGERETLLRTVTERIRRSLDLDEILATVTQQVKAVLNCDRVIIFQVFPDGRGQIVEEAVAEEFARLKDRHWEDETWSQEILEMYWQGIPRIVADVNNDVWTHCLTEYNLEGQIRSKVVAPILLEVPLAVVSRSQDRWVTNNGTKQLWGILVAYACREQRQWLPSEAELLQQIANQLAIAIQQANLFRQLQQELRDRQQAQQELAERNQQLVISNQELARATRLKDEFLANMSHELRAPLNAILGMNESLQEGIFGPINEQQQRVLRTIEKSSTHLLELINDILDLDKIEAGQVTLEYTTSNIQCLCESSLLFIKDQALKKQIQVRLQVAPNLPAIRLDERRIRQVLINLLSNAVKFTPIGGQITLQVDLEAPTLAETGTDIVLVKEGNTDAPTNATTDREGIPHTAHIRFAVIDTGIGIAATDLGKLFQPFVQIDSALNRQYAGTGLGLSLVKRIVELHRGSVAVSSEVGRGSCFSFTLPCSPIPQTASTPAVTISAVSLPTTTQGHLPLILLAEDNEANIMTISAYLKAKGYQLMVARDGQAAIAQAQAQRPDLILMDIQMPGMDGLMAIQQLRRDPQFAQLPIIALTALAMPGDRERCLAAGADEYLTKPVKLRQLVDLIQRLLVPYYT
ncbi:PAS domain S-box protein [Trichothermofontia sichuanensis B231]|uniref:PAS domain S-box protein n=1 Tax=Trichothermofontia sichuanensis TaxID=3045816 RepID=UPI0022473249|nr:PAS domain S-box protein [Trichothermofontia sichuanensis]UZQ56072.1 PAS domain S-box protein [Trichothermofontia sichuanensis B231]